MSRIKTLSLLFFLTLSYSFSQLKKELTNTLWEQEGYDRILQIQDSTYIYFNRDSFSCSPLVQGNFNGRFKMVYHDKDLLILNPGGVVNYRFRRISSLPKRCNSDRKQTNNSFIINFKSFWETFDRNYAFFEKRNIDWKEVYNDYLPKVKTTNSNRTFGMILKEIVKKFNDGHIRLDIPELNITTTKTPETNNSYPKKDVLDRITRKYLSKSYTYNNGVIRWGVTTNKNYGYLGITDMNGFSNYVPSSFQNTVDFDSIYTKREQSYQPLEQFENEIKGVAFVMDKILKDLNETKSIIIDLRFNGGGYETVSLKLLSYFINAKKHIFSVKSKTKNGFTPIQKYYIEPSQKSNKKIYVLTSPFSSSATEIFVLGSLSYDNFKRMGSKTSGIFSEILWKQLPNGWEYSLSNEVYMNRNNKSYEGEGINVDLDVGYSTNSVVFYKSFFSPNTFSDKLIEQLIKE